jgi:predicted transcriptional regulator
MTVTVELIEKILKLSENSSINDMSILVETEERKIQVILDFLLEFGFVEKRNEKFMRTKLGNEILNMPKAYG